MCLAEKKDKDYKD